jgi:hypothetical protein
VIGQIDRICINQSLYHNTMIQINLNSNIFET